MRIHLGALHRTGKFAVVKKARLDISRLQRSGARYPAMRIANKVSSKKLMN